MGRDENDVFMSIFLYNFFKRKLKIGVVKHLY